MLSKFLKEGWDFIKANFKALLVAGAFLFLYLQGCFNQFKPQPPQIVTTTQYIPQPIVVNPPYQPQQAGPTIYPITLPPNYQGTIPASTIDSLVAQVLELNKKMTDLAREYFAEKNYKDSIQLKDTAGRRVGVVNLNQKVSENTLKSTQSSYQLTFPYTTTTITQLEKARNKVFVGITTESIVEDYTPTGAGVMVSLENKRNTVIGLSLNYDWSVKSPIYQLSLQKLISLRKR